MDVILILGTSIIYLQTGISRNVSRYAKFCLNCYEYPCSSGNRRGTRTTKKHQKSGSSSRGEGTSGSHQGARRISLDDLSSAFQALISNSSAAVAASMSKKKSNHSSRASTKSLMNRSFVQASTPAAITNDCCQSDNGGLGDNSRGSPARMRSRSEENLLDSKSVSLSSSHHRYDPAGRGISCSPASLKQSISIRSNDSSGASTGGRLNLSSRYSYILVLYYLSNVEISGYNLQVLFRKIIKI